MSRKRSVYRPQFSSLWEVGVAVSGMHGGHVVVLEFGIVFAEIVGDEMVFQICSSSSRC